MNGDHVLVHLNSCVKSCIVPEHLADNPGLTLKLSYLFQGDTTHDDEAITTYLKFSGNYQKCVLPWSCIWGMTGDKGEQRTWPKDIPKELFFQAAKQQLSAISKKLFKVERGAGTPSPHEHASVAKEPDNQTAPHATKEKGHLRRIK